jgi:hypothetical protein
MFDGLFQLEEDNLRDEDVETEVMEAAKNILRIITHGNNSHVLRKEDQVLLLGDHRDLSPVYTESLAQVIRDWQEKKGGKVIVKYLPYKRPISNPSEIDPSVTKAAAEADVVIGTYSNPGETIRNAESASLNSAVFKTVFDRIQKEKIRLYAVAGRPNIRVLETLADLNAIEETNLLSKKLMRYLRGKSEQEMQVYTLKEGKYGDPLRFIVPSPELVSADYFEAVESIINIPSGEVFFEPVPGTAKGKLYFKEGSYYHLFVPIKGMIIMEFDSGEITDCRDLGRKDDEVHKFIAKHLERKENRHLAEMGIGTYVAGSDLPMEDMVYNSTILEKLQGFHVAYGSSIHIKGKHDAPEHIDNWIKYGDVYVGDDHLIQKGRVNERVLGD